MRVSLSWLSGCSFQLFPGRCILCQSRTHRALDLCLACEHDLPRVSKPCHRCGLSLLSQAPGHQHYCGPCLVTPPQFDLSYSAFSYAAPVRQLITEFKQHQKMVVGEVLGQLLARSYREHILTRGSQQQVSKPDLLLPMPLHASRLKLRGFNQAETIARVVSLQTDVAVDSQTCRRIKQTHDQKGLTAKDRRNNVKDAFEVTRTLQGLHVAIVDDVMTTAATVSALSLTLRRAGASFVEIIALARTPAPK